MEWIPVTERLPVASPDHYDFGNSKPVLLLCHDDDESIILVGVYNYRRKEWHAIPDDEDQFPMHTTTHWMPLPAPPLS